MIDDKQKICSYNLGMSFMLTNSTLGNSNDLLVSDCIDQRNDLRVK